jgi:hypothetical protein
VIVRGAGLAQHFSQIGKATDFGPDGFCVLHGLLKILYRSAHDFSSSFRG